MAEEKKRRRQRDKKQDVELGPLGKKKGKIINSLNAGNMVAVLSGMEMMYVLKLQGSYHCFIHPFDSEEGRHKAWEINERNTAMLDNLYSAADSLFEIRFSKELNLMGVMVAAERGIIAYLDMTGNLPAQDMDFMDWQEQENSTQEDSKHEDVSI
jgi:hypothetical protein